MREITLGGWVACTWGGWPGARPWRVTLGVAGVSFGVYRVTFGVLWVTLGVVGVSFGVYRVTFGLVRVTSGGGRG